MRLAKTLEGTEGLESANANLMGQVVLTYDDDADLPGRAGRRGWRAAGFASSSSPESSGIGGLW